MNNFENLVFYYKCFDARSNFDKNCLEISYEGE